MRLGAWLLLTPCDHYLLLSLSEGEKGRDRRCGGLDAAMLAIVYTSYTTMRVQYDWKMDANELNMNGVDNWWLSK